MELSAYSNGASPLKSAHSRGALVRKGALTKRPGRALN